MLKYISAIFTTLFLGIGAAQACNYPPPICSQVPGLIAPAGNVYQYGGTAGPQQLASGSNPQWNWSSYQSYAYIYGGALPSPGFNPNDLEGFTYTIAYSWSNPFASSPGSGSGNFVDIHCFIAANSGEIWFYTVSNLGYYDQIAGEPPNSQVSISCPIGGLNSNGFGPPHWFNGSGQSPATDFNAAQRWHATMSNANTAIFAMGLVFGDNACTPNWDGANFKGNVHCWIDGAFAQDSHFAVFENAVH